MFWPLSSPGGGGASGGSCPAPIHLLLGNPVGEKARVVRVKAGQGGSRQSKQLPVCALRTCTASPSPLLQTARPGTWAPAAAAARARALCDPAPAQHFIPRVACCRSHRFPTCARALGPPRLCPRALQDHGVGGPPAGRGIHQALTFTSNANSAYLIPAAPPSSPGSCPPLSPWW